MLVLIETDFPDRCLRCDREMKGYKLMAAFADNATNGDVIRALFPDTEWEYYPEDEHYNTCLRSSNAGVSLRWWDAPYKRGEM